MRNFNKHLGNMISWISFIINILVILLILNNKIPTSSIVFSVFGAAILDMFDGKIARMFVTDKKDFVFGELTDSLCDTINFGIIPACTFIYFFKNNILICFIISSFYLWAIVFRLARFSRDKTEGVVKYYIGLPVTVAGPISVFLIVTLQNHLPILIFIQLILSYLMVSNIKIKKLKI